MSSTASALDPDVQTALESAVAALRSAAGYALDAEIDEFMVELGERKDSLGADEHKALLALVTLTQERSNDKLAAMRALKKLGEVFPEIVNGM